MNKAIIAVAGAGKTEQLISLVAMESRPERAIVLTYTTMNQFEDSARIAQKAVRGNTVPVLGWKAFLLNEIVLPYLPRLYLDVQLHGLAPSDPQSFKFLKGESRYLTKDGRAYPSMLGKLAFDVINASNSAAIRRLEQLFDSIYIDEGQDLRGNDLCVLEALFKSSINITIVLDPRQSTLSTADRDSKYKNYQYARIIKLYRLWERKKLLEIKICNETHRFIPDIALLSDRIFSDELHLEKTISHVKPRGTHDGVYLINKNDLSSYASKHDATLLSLKESSRFGVPHAMNFGASKGLTRDDVFIFATNPIEKFLMQGTPLSEKSACGFYVALTRARYSVAIAVKYPDKVLSASHNENSPLYSIGVKRE